MKKLLLDTSVIIDFLRRKDKSESLFYKLSKEELHISIISHTELFAGKSIWEKQQAYKIISEVFKGVTIIPLTEDISEKAGYIRAYNLSNSLIDSIIAAAALEHSLELVTLNRKDFEHIQNLKLFSEDSLLS